MHRLVIVVVPMFVSGAGVGRAGEYEYRQIKYACLFSAVS